MGVCFILQYTPHDVLDAKDCLFHLNCVHRGYAFEEVRDSKDSPESDREEDAVAGGRKVVILGDTISSIPMAPLSLDCDVIAHEATFSKGVVQQ